MAHFRARAVTEDAESVTEPDAGGVTESNTSSDKETSPSDREPVTEATKPKPDKYLALALRMTGGNEDLARQIAFHLRLAEKKQALREYYGPLGPP